VYGTAWWWQKMPAPI